MRPAIHVFYGCHRVFIASARMNEPAVRMQLKLTYELSSSGVCAAGGVRA